MTQKEFQQNIRKTIRLALNEKEEDSIIIGLEEIVILAQSDLIAVSKLMQYGYNKTAVTFFIKEGIRDLALLYYAFSLNKDFAIRSVLNSNGDIFKGLEKKCLAIIKVKNNDYAKEFDPFLNFRKSVLVNIASGDAIAVRLQDKVTRIGNLLDKEASVKDETKEDTIIDFINYLAILKAYLETLN